MDTKHFFPTRSQQKPVKIFSLNFLLTSCFSFFPTVPRWIYLINHTCFFTNHLLVQMRLNSWVWGPFRTIHFWVSCCFRSWGYPTDHKKCWDISGFLCCRTLCNSTVVIRGDLQSQGTQKIITFSINWVPIMGGCGKQFYVGVLPKKCPGFFFQVEKYKCRSEDLRSAWS